MDRSTAVRFTTRSCWIAFSIFISYAAAALLNSSSAKHIINAQAREIERFRAEDKAEQIPNYALDWDEVAQEIGKRPVFLLDTRSRDAFASGHLLGAINIPTNELKIRAVNEIPAEHLVVVFCGYRVKCEGRFAAIGTKTPCTSAARLLSNELGFPDVVVLRNDSESLLSRGVPFAFSNHQLRLSILNDR